MRSNYSITLDVLNHEETERLVPLIVYLVIIMVTGIPGNILVIIIYKRNAGKSNYQFFITCLAVVDCITCCIVPFVIYEAARPYTFHGNWLCKFTLFLQCWPTLISGGTLHIIGIDRYRMVCKPHGRQITNKKAKISWVILVFLSALLASPLLVLMGVREIPIHPYNTTGTECTVLKEYDDTDYFKLFSGLLWILFMTGLISIVLLYSFIGKRIFYHAKKCNSESPTPSTPNSKPEISSGGNESNEPMASATRNETNTMSDASVEIKVSEAQTGDSGFTSTDIEMENVQPTAYKGKRRATRSFSTASRMQNKKESKARQSVFIMFLISVFFIISFLPHLIVRLMGAVDVELIYAMSDETRAAYKFFIRSYFINSAVNPFVYCACATKFRKDAKALFFGRTRH